MNPLLNLFESILPLTAADKALLDQHTSVEIIKKREEYCVQGAVCKKMGFVVDGVFKVVRTNAKGEEYILYFTNEGHFVVDLESFSNQTPAEENIEALTTSTVISMTRVQYDYLETAIPNFSKIISQIKEKALLAKYNFKSEMLVDDAITKYQKLVQRQPTVIQRVSQSEIATFLGITKYTLSRIRAKK